MKVNFNEPILQVNDLKIKFDVVPVSGSMEILIGDRDQAQVVQQLHYWATRGYGVMIDGIRWFWKTIKDWQQEVFPSFTSYKLRKILQQLCDRGLIRREKLFRKHHNIWWQPQITTCYYSLNTEKLQELADNFEIPEKLENSAFRSGEKLRFANDQKAKVCDYLQTNTNTTSTENKIQKTHSPEAETRERARGENKEPSLNNPDISQDKQSSTVLVQDLENDKSSPSVDVKIKPNKSTNKPPWKNLEQLKQFYQALVEALPRVANARSPQAVAEKIVSGLRQGRPHTFWDDFAEGREIGESTKPEWQISPGVPYPMFIEYLTEKLRKGNNTQTREQAIAEALRIANSPQQASFFWEECKRSLQIAASDAEKQLQLGVNNPCTPLWTKERSNPDLIQAAIAGEKIQQINRQETLAVEMSREIGLLPGIAADQEIADPWQEEKPITNLKLELAKRGVKGFANLLPTIPQAETSTDIPTSNLNNHISQMNMQEINRCLQDPILRAQLTPQLFNSDYEIITDNLGQIIAVERGKERGE